MSKIKILELFGGIGSPRKALENLGVDLKSIDYVEWWNWAVYAYNKLFNNDYKTENIIDWNLNIDILIHGSPCQDFSQAGKNDLKSGRSILYKRTLEIIEKELNSRPKVVIWENVKGLINKRNFPHFQHYLDSMEKFGYINKYKVLNSLNFGIPQNRERVFVVSIHKNYLKEFGHFKFENLETKPLEPLSNFLEKDVDKSYFITQNSMISAIKNGKIKIIDNIVQTITTKQWRWNNAGVVKISLYKKEFYQTDKVHKIDKSISTIGTKSQNNRIAIPILKMPTKDFKNFKTYPRELDGKLVNGSYNRIWKIDNYIETISSSRRTKIMIELDKPIPGIPIFIIDDKPYHLRILTERECWRLFGWEDFFIDKVIPGTPKSHLYHMAGNSIVIPVQEAIFKELLWKKLNQS